ncbi:MAG: iron chelate uptake ABC transporter family permease subunit [Rubripirellula sp.]|nr:iron chelate uptake ABC transporter family permease subunit [Rubripirellula sp.]
MIVWPLICRFLLLLKWAGCTIVGCGFALAESGLAAASSGLQAADSGLFNAGQLPVVLKILPLAQSESITDRRISLPSWEQWQRVLLMQDYNTRVVILGTAMLGCAAGVVGCFTLLRKRALMGDALSHATLPGIALAFMTANAMGWQERSLPWLLLGATASGLVGVAAILAIRRLTHLKEDTALGIVLSVFFGCGIAMMGVIQQMQTGHAAGLESFILGKTASMGASDAKLIAAAALIATVVCVLLFKELKLLCFDEGFAGSQGFNVLSLDLVLMATVVLISIVGLQAVGLILMIALLIVPAAAARFWTEKMWEMLLIAAVLGLISGIVGAVASALFPRLPSGAMIVLTCAAFFIISMVFGTGSGVLVRTVRRLRLNRKVVRRHLLRAVFEALESQPNKTTPKGETKPKRTVSFNQILPMRSWSKPQLQRAAELAAREELITQVGEKLRFTRRGRLEAERLTREHRLWELYLITHADIAPSRVDREADRIEHVLEPDVVAELEEMLINTRQLVPESPHLIQANPSSANQNVADAGSGDAGSGDIDREASP